MPSRREGILNKKPAKPETKNILSSPMPARLTCGRFFCYNIVKNM